MSRRLYLVRVQFRMEMCSLICSLNVFTFVSIRSLKCFWFFDIGDWLVGNIFEYTIFMFDDVLKTISMILFKYSIKTLFGFVALLQIWVKRGNFAFIMTVILLYPFCMFYLFLWCSGQVFHFEFDSRIRFPVKKVAELMP